MIPVINIISVYLFLTELVDFKGGRALYLLTLSTPDTHDEADPDVVQHNKFATIN